MPPHPCSTWWLTFTTLSSEANFPLSRLVVMATRTLGKCCLTFITRVNTRTCLRGLIRTSPLRMWTWSQSSTKTQEVGFQGLFSDISMFGNNLLRATDDLKVSLKAYREQLNMDDVFYMWVLSGWGVILVTVENVHPSSETGLTWGDLCSRNLNRM